MCIPRESGLGESRIKRRLLNGPLRAQSKALLYGHRRPPSILRRWAYVSCRRYDGISSECAGIPVKQGGTADEYEIMILFSKRSCGKSVEFYDLARCDCDTETIMKLKS